MDGARWPTAKRTAVASGGAQDSVRKGGPRGPLTEAEQEHRRVVARRLRGLIRAAGFETQRAFAKAAGLREYEVSRLCRDRDPRRPSDRQLRKVAEALGWPLHELAGACMYRGSLELQVMEDAVAARHAAECELEHTKKQLADARCELDALREEVVAAGSSATGATGRSAPMRIELHGIPRTWAWMPAGVVKMGEEGPERPRELASFLMQALDEAHTAGFLSTGQPRAEEPEMLLVRSMLCRRIAQSSGAVELSPPELELLERCIAACFCESVSVPVLGQLHASIAQEQQQQAEDKEEP